MDLEELLAMTFSISIGILAIIGLADIADEFMPMKGVECPETQKLISKEFKAFGKEHKVLKCVNKEKENNEN